MLRLLGTYSGRIMRLLVAKCHKEGGSAIDPKNSPIRAYYALVSAVYAPTALNS
jgi:hypothetical protein